MTCEKRKGKAVETVEDLSRNLLTVYVLAFAFSSLFTLSVLQVIRILFHHLFAVETLRAFIILLFKIISVFRLGAFFRCDTTNGASARAVISQSNGSARSGLFLF